MRRKKVAICSRDSKQNYQWLIDFLEKRMCKKTKIEARPVYITNNMSKFRQEVSGYNFAILYHTKKRGRINITNVTSSLYDEELQFLRDMFGKKKVVVVIDDLEKSDDDEKRRIIEAQRDLSKYAQDVFLFTQEDKNYTENHLNKMENEVVKKKLTFLKKYIKKASGVINLRLCNTICTRPPTSIVDFFVPLVITFHLNKNDGWIWIPQTVLHDHQTELFSMIIKRIPFLRTPRPLHDV